MGFEPTTSALGSTLGRSENGAQTTDRRTHYTRSARFATTNFLQRKHVSYGCLPRFVARNFGLFQSPTSLRKSMTYRPLNLHTPALNTSVDSKGICSRVSTGPRRLMQAADVRVTLVIEETVENTGGIIVGALP